MTARVNRLRDRITDWAVRHHGAELHAAVALFLGDSLRDEQAVRTAVAFALVSAPPGGTSLIERFARGQPTLPRAERELFAQWARARFGLLRVAAVEEGAHLDLHDVVARRAFRAYEPSATEQLEPGDWVAAFYFEDAGRTVLEGAITAVPAGARLGAVQALLGALQALGTPPAEASPEATRQAARPTIAALHQALAAPPEPANPEALGWTAQPLAALGGQRPAEAAAAGREAELWALLPADPSAEAAARALGMWTPGAG